METARKRLEAIFDAALELPDAAHRAAFLEQACMDDLLLRTQVERLLMAHERSERFFDECRPALAVTEPGDLVDTRINIEEEIGKHIGRYKLLQNIGEGGCGVVFMAEQEKPVRRRVALKVIKLGMDTKNVVARFEAERQALALMEHPNIARVLDAGATGTGRPYFVMELVNGVKITNFCDERQFDTRQRLELFMQVCHAIQHAHQKGIIHRDVKPSNILVTQHDGVAVPKVIDFGIAKATQEQLTDKTLFTIYGHFVGTPAYMSPEQADFSGLDVDTRSDIYSLGVLLYELLTGKTPFEQSELLAAGLDEMRKTLRESEPHRPSTRLDTMPTAELTMTAQRRQVEPPKLQLLLKGDLDWIVMKCLEKNRARRYETANGLAMDIQRYLDNEPVLARPPSRWYRFQKLVGRNRGVFAAVGAVSVALILGLSMASWLFIQERSMRHRAVAAEQLAEQARANESTLRRQAETREKITQAALFISQGKPGEADQLALAGLIHQPSVEGAAVLRSLGEWHALNGRWQVSGERFLQLLQVNQLDSRETRAQDFLRCSAALAMAADTNQFAAFRRDLVRIFASGKNLIMSGQMLKAGLLLPADTNFIQSLQPLLQTLAPGPQASVGNSAIPAGPPLKGDDDFLAKLKLVNIGSAVPCSISRQEGMIELVAGGADIWGKEDQFAYASMLLAGDFDYRMRVHSISPKPDNFTRVGLMARETPDQAGSRHVMVAVNAGDTFQVVMRSQDDAFGASVPQDPLPAAYGSNSWVRLQRVGAIFHAYTSSNGVDWVQLYQTTGGDKPFADPIYLGIAACAHSTNEPATNILSDFSPTPTMTVNVAVALALVALREGDFNAAAHWCRLLLAYPECNPVQTATAEIILALAESHLNETEAAREQLAQGRALVAGRNYNYLEPGNGTEGFWFDWIFARVLLQEADLLVR